MDKALELEVHAYALVYGVPEAVPIPRDALSRQALTWTHLPQGTIVCSLRSYPLQGAEWSPLLILPASSSSIALSRAASITAVLLAHSVVLAAAIGSWP